jgi:poly [ADP-ribose] polymerase
MDLMTDVMQKRGFDTKKMPLGKLSRETLEKAHKVLLKIEEVLDKKKKGDLMELSGDFYTLVPHDFGFQKMSQFVINTKEKLKEKLETLESLGDLEFANSIISKAGDGSIVDSNYKKLNADIEPVEPGTDEYEVVQKYFDNTCDNNKITIEQLYKISRHGEEKRFDKKVGSDFLLWHGSPITNMVSILSGGLKVRCTELPWLSDRIFHADMIAKSIGYTGYYSSNNTAMVLLDRVALGKQPRYCEGGFGVWSEIPKKHTSIVLSGQHKPPESSYEKHKGITVPIGKPPKTNNVKFIL